VGGGYDFSTQTAGNTATGDCYFVNQSGANKFWANNVGMNGLQDVGSSTNLESVTIPTTGDVTQGVPAVAGHTYVAMAATGEANTYMVFNLTAASNTQADRSYIYRVSPLRDRCERAIGGSSPRPAQQPVHRLGSPVTPPSEAD
jgi:hypothetical protein